MNRIEYPTLLAVEQSGSVLRRLGLPQPWALAYCPFGYAPLSNERERPAFNGQWSELTSAYLLGNGYRAYSPQLMRFNGADSFSPFGEGGINAYAYCAADPINNVDPSGHVTAAILATRHRLLAPAKASFASALNNFRLGRRISGRSSVIAGRLKSTAMELAQAQRRASPLGFSNEKFPIFAAHHTLQSPNGAQSLLQKVHTNFPLKPPSKSAIEIPPIYDYATLPETLIKAPPISSRGRNSNSSPTIKSQQPDSRLPPRNPPHPSAVDMLKQWRTNQAMQEIRKAGRR